MVEAVILLPVLAILLFGILYVRELRTIGQRARLDLRRCAWSYAMNGCAELPAGCALSTRVTTTEMGLSASPEAASLR